MASQAVASPKLLRHPNPCVTQTLASMPRAFMSMFKPVLLLLLPLQVLALSACTLELAPQASATEKSGACLNGGGGARDFAEVVALFLEALGETELRIQKICGTDVRSDTSALQLPDLFVRIRQQTNQLAGTLSLREGRAAEDVVLEIMDLSDNLIVVVEGLPAQRLEFFKFLITSCDDSFVNDVAHAMNQNVATLLSAYVEAYALSMRTRGWRARLTKLEATVKGYLESIRFGVGER